MLVGAAVVLVAQHQERDRSRRRPGREAVAAGAARSRVSAGAPVPHLDDARHVRARRVHPRVSCRCSRRCSPARSASSRATRRAASTSSSRRTRAIRCRSTRSRAKPGVRAVAPLVDARPAGRARARPHRPRPWSGDRFRRSRSSSTAPPALDDRGSLRERRAPRTRPCSPIRDLAIVDKFFLAGGHRPAGQAGRRSATSSRSATWPAARERTFTVAAIARQRLSPTTAS